MVSVPNESCSVPGMRWVQSVPLPAPGLGRCWRVKMQPEAMTMFRQCMRDLGYPIVLRSFYRLLAIAIDNCAASSFASPALSP